MRQHSGCIGIYWRSRLLSLLVCVEQSLTPCWSKRQSLTLHSATPQKAIQDSDTPIHTRIQIIATATPNILCACVSPSPSHQTTADRRANFKLSVDKKKEKERNKTTRRGHEHEHTNTRGHEEPTYCSRARAKRPPRQQIPSRRASRRAGGDGAQHQI